MSENIIRIALDEEPDGSTDWARLRGMDDEAIDAAIAADPDSYALDENDLRQGNSLYRYQIYSAGHNWRWRLVAPDGQILAVSAENYASENAVMFAVDTVRTAFRTGKIAA